MYIPLREVELAEDELAQIEVEIEARGEMPTRNKQVLREVLKREARYWKWRDQDHINGYDDGEQVGVRD